MAYDTIDTHQTISRFHQLMHLQGPYRILCLSGDGKMGKTHLLTKIFPDLARQQYQAPCALLDIRNALHTVPDLLEMLCSQLGMDHFQNYYSAHQAWTSRPKVEIRGLMAKLSRIDISAKESVDDARARDRQLTSHFVRDLATFAGTVLLLVDNVSSAPEGAQTWLMDNLLVQLSSLSQVRTVIAGRVLPEAHGSYTTRCLTCHLQPVKDVTEYIAFCQRLQATLSEQSIRDIAYVCDYTPGFFTDLVISKFVR